MLEHRRRDRLFEDPRAAHGIAQGGHPFGEGELGDFEEARAIDEGMEGLPGQEQAARAIDRHRDEPRAFGIGGV